MAQSSTPSAPPNLNLRNPTPLSAFQESQVRDIYHRRVRGYCAKEIKAFAECATNRTVTATWVCRCQRLAMNSCMIQHATPDEEDRAREEWFAGREERRRERETKEQETEQRRSEIVRMMREDEARRQHGTKNPTEKGTKGWFSWGKS